MTEFLNLAKAQNGTAANGTAPANGLAANGTAGGLNGLPASSAIASPTSSPLSDIVPGSGSGSGSDSSSGSGSDAGAGAGAGAADECTCNCLCDLGSPGMGGLVGSIPLPNAGALGKRVVNF
jgi:hypothetical protein